MLENVTLWLADVLVKMVKYGIEAFPKKKLAWTAAPVSLAVTWSRDTHVPPPAAAAQITSGQIKRLDGELSAPTIHAEGFGKGGGCIGGKPLCSWAAATPVENGRTRIARSPRSASADLLFLM